MLIAEVEVSVMTSLELLITNNSLPVPPTSVSSAEFETSVSAPLFADPLTAVAPVSTKVFTLVGSE